MNLSHSPNTRRQIEELQQELIEKRKALRELRRSTMSEPIAKEYRFAGTDGATATLAELFDHRQELFLIHNMGTGCRYCTLWADGFNGMLPHLENRAAFVVVSPDPPEKQQAFALSRGWRFRMWSTGDEFLVDMKMADEKGAPWPGISVFKRQESGLVVRTGYDYFGPGDDYCPIWHIMDLLPEGAGDWRPRHQYDH